MYQKSTQWSERISNMTKRDFENYIHKFKSNHLKVMKMQLVKNITIN